MASTAHIRLYCCCSDQSKQLNESRIGVLQAREEALHSILKDAQSQIAALTKDKKKYKNLLTDLIVQVGPFANPDVLACPLLDLLMHKHALCDIHVRQLPLRHETQ